MENYLIFFLIISKFICGQGLHYVLQSEIKYFDGENYKGQSSYSPWNSIFPNMTESERNTLCARSQTEMHLDELATEYPSMADPKLHLIGTIHVIRCTTVPTLYLRRGDRNGDEVMIIVMMEMNKFVGPGSPEFDISVVDFDPISCKESFQTNPRYIDTDPDEVDGLTRYVCEEDKILNASHLSKFSETRRFHLCHAAIRYSNEKGHMPVSLSNRVDDPQIYEIRSSIFDEAETKKRVALRCPTSPRIHVYFQNIRMNQDVQVLVTNEN